MLLTIASFAHASYGAYIPLPFGNIVRALLREDGSGKGLATLPLRGRPSKATPHLTKRADKQLSRTVKPPMTSVFFTDFINNNSAVYE